MVVSSHYLALVAVERHKDVLLMHQMSTPSLYQSATLIVDHHIVT